MKNAVRSFLLLSIVIYAAFLNISWAAAAEEKTESQVKPLYSDVTYDNPNYAFVTYLAKRGIISGFSDGTYHPNDSLTRAQAAVIMTKAAGLSSSAASSAFKDVPASHWAAGYIAAAERAGYLKGFGDGTFRPDQTLTRAQAISLVMRLSVQKDRASLPPLQDIDSKHWAAADMATALELTMISTSKDGNTVNPEMAMSRADLAKALAILLTKDPGLNQIPLLGKVSEIQGTITLTRGDKTQALAVGMSVGEGNTINSAAGGRGCIVYPDGSSMLIEANSQLVVKSSRGRQYIKQDGTPGMAVDYLNIEIPQGTIFGALAAQRGEEKNGETQKQQARLSSLFASQNSFKQLAAAEAGQAQPWYRTAEQKKVKVKVDMPWGVAAVRGTFYKMTVNPDGSCKVSCLTGNVEVSGSKGNTVSLTGNQSSAITSAGGSPAAAAAMSPEEVEAFNQEQAWVLQTAVDMDLAVEMVIGVPANSANKANTLQAIISALQASGIQLTAEMKNSLKQQLNQIEKQSNDPYKGTNIQSQLTGTPSSSSSSGGGGGGSTTSSTSTGITCSTEGVAYGPEDSAHPLTVSSVTIDAADVTIRNLVVQGDVTVNQPGAILQNITISGNLVLGTGIAEGDATLSNVTIAGSTVITGGGGHSIHLNGTIGSVTINKANNSVRVVAQGNTSVGALTLNSGAIVEESGCTGTGFSSIVASNLIPANASIILNGVFDSLTIDAANLDIFLESGQITNLNIAATAAGTSINLAAGTSITNLTANAAASITGTGQITSAVINANGVTIEQVPLAWNLGVGITVVIGGASISTDGVISSACVLSNIAGLSGASVVGSNVSGSVPNDVASLMIIPTISDYATWKLYDSSGTVEIPTNSIGLSVGDNTFCVKVTAQDGSEQNYALTINRAAGAALSTACNVLSIATLTNITITEGVNPVISGNATASTETFTVTPTISEDATWKLFSDAACSSEIGSHVMTISNGININYIQVIAENGNAQVYVLKVNRPSNNALVTSIGTDFVVQSGSNPGIISGASLVINTSTTVSDFLSHLTKDVKAVWKVVNKQAAITASTQYDNATAKLYSDNLYFEDILAVKAEDGTVQSYNISVVLGDPVRDPALLQPAAPTITYNGNNEALKIGACTEGFLWGKYKYFAYDFVNPNIEAIAVVAFDGNTVVGAWTHSRGKSKQVIDYAINLNNGTVKYATNIGNGVPVSLNDIRIAQP